MGRVLKNVSPGVKTTIHYLLPYSVSVASGVDCGVVVNGGVTLGVCSHALMLTHESMESEHILR